MLFCSEIRVNTMLGRNRLTGVQAVHQGRVTSGTK